jgi:hypothetical protein
MKQLIRFAPSIVQLARSTVSVRRLALLRVSVLGQQLRRGHRRLLPRKRVATTSAFQTKRDCSLRRLPNEQKGFRRPHHLKNLSLTQVKGPIRATGADEPVLSTDAREQARYSCFSRHGGRVSASKRGHSPSKALRLTYGFTEVLPMQPNSTGAYKAKALVEGRVWRRTGRSRKLL